jgi:hypothetical protein
MINRKKKVVKSSGMELAIALIVAPRTPSDKLRPIYSEAVMNPSPARQITRQQIAINIRGISIPIFEVLVEKYLFSIAGGRTKIITLSNLISF